MESSVRMLKQNLLQPEPSDEILADRIAKRDSEALDIIYDRYASNVFTLAGMLSDCAEAERIALEVFCRLWLEADQFRFHEGTFQDWFLSLARAHILNMLVHTGRRTAKDLLEAINRWLSDVAIQKLETREGLHPPGSGIRVWQSLLDLTLEQRCVIVLASYGGYQQKEIALLLNLPLSAVKQHARLGLKELRESRKQELVLERV
jgi:RNA polymerase sigma factor (sigma-70 family)